MDGTPSPLDLVWLMDFVWDLWDMPVEIYGFSFSLRQVLVFGAVTSILGYAIREYFDS